MRPLRAISAHFLQALGHAEAGIKPLHFSPWHHQRCQGPVVQTKHVLHLDLNPPEVLASLKRIESRGTVETARRCRGYVSQVFDYAISTGRAASNPAKSLSAALQRTVGGLSLIHISEPTRPY